MLLKLVTVDFFVTKHLLPFFLGKIRICIKADSGAVIFIVMLGYFLERPLKLSKPKFPLLPCSVILCMLI